MIVVCMKDGVTVSPYLYQRGDIFIYDGLYSDELEELEGSSFDTKQKSCFGEVLLRKPTAEELYRGLKNKVFTIGECTKKEKKKLIPFLRDKKVADQKTDEILMKQLEPEIEEEEKEPVKKTSSSSKKGAKKTKKS